jgi:hypothetical protein
LHANRAPRIVASMPSRILLLAFVAACNAPPAQTAGPYGVEIFAEDTVTASLSITVTGDLQINLVGDNFRVLADRSFIVSTPATLVISRGVGTATITSVDSVSRLAVVPLGTPDDSVDAATVAGTVVKFTRLGYEQGKVRLSTARP